MAIISNHVNNYSPVQIAPLGQIGQVSSVTTTSIPAAAGALDVRGRLIINGRDLEERLNTIEKVLEIPERDVKLERKHPKLRKLYEEYIHALAKYRTFDAIKGDDK